MAVVRQIASVWTDPAGCVACGLPLVCALVYEWPSTDVGGLPDEDDEALLLFWQCGCVRP